MGNRSTSPIFCAWVIAVLLSLSACDTPTAIGPAEENAAVLSDPSLALGQRQDKVSVCHLAEPGVYRKLEIAAPAVEAHLRHGDLLPGDLLDENCRPYEQPYMEVTRSPLADGSVRDGVPREIPKDGFPDAILDGSVVQVLNSDSPIGEMEDRGILEFDLTGLPPMIVDADLVLSVFRSVGPYPFDVDVYGYAGDGLLTLSDFNAGTPRTSFVYAGETEVVLDVTALVGDLVSSGADVAGLNLRVPVPSPIALNGPFVAFNSMEIPAAAVLKVTFAVTP